MVIEEFQQNGDHTPIDPEDFSVLKSSPENDFDEITALSAHICGTPIAVIQIIEKDEPWLKSVYGISKEKIPEDPFFWEKTLNRGRLLSIRDIREEASFKGFENKHNFVFYAGIPLTTTEGLNFGVLYVLDTKPRELSKKQEESLYILSNQILHLLESRKQNFQLREVQKKLRQKYTELEKFASVVSHDIKSPLANIISLTELLREENKDNISPETQQYIDFLAESSYSLRNYVDGILSFYRSDHILEKGKEDVDLNSFFKNITQLFLIRDDVRITYPTSGTLQDINKAALTQIFLNLISNALKYNDKPVRKVNIGFRETPQFYEFEVLDNGVGIRPEHSERIFDLFTTLETNDREGNPGSGIGLATVKKILDHLEGSISVESRIPEGSNFKFKIKRK